MVGNSNLPTPPWQLKFDAATRESDPNKLAKLLIEAEDAIFARLQELDGQITAESQAIDNAVKALRELQVTKLNFPKWEGDDFTLRSV
jgi:hypothetical protein